MEIKKNKELDKVRKRKEKEKKISPLSYEDKRLFSKIRTAIKKQKKG